MEYVFNEENFEQEVINSSVPVMVDMFAVWCGPCKMMSPEISAAAEKFEGRAKVGKLDIDQNPDLAEKYGVTAVPTVFIFSGGKAVKKLVGYMDREFLCSELEKLMR